MDESDKQLVDILQKMFEADMPGCKIAVVPVSVNGAINEEKKVLGKALEYDFQSMPDGTNDINERFYFTLVGMAQWAVAHPSTSKFEYLSPETIKASKNLQNAFMQWWYNDHPYVKPEQQKMFDQSIKNGLFPAAVMEHTADGHHPIGWSWGSEWYLADYYLCLTYATIQLGTRLGKDVKDKFAPIYIAKQVQALNRVKPTVEIVEAMDKLMEEPEPNKTAEYGVVDVEGSSN
jgi:hypothetical protein